MFKTTIRIISLIVLLVLPIGQLLATGAPEQSLGPSATQPVLDSRGVEISLGAPPRKIVSLSPNITEILYALGLGETVVGRTDYCDYPEQVSSVPSMGDLFTPSIEKIVASEADLVIISNLGQLQTIEAIERAGVTVAFLDEPGTMEGTFSIIRKVGLLTDREEASLALVDSMRQTLEKARRIVGDGPYPSAYYVAGFGEWGDFTATGDTYLHEVLTLAGTKNIAADAVNWSYQLELLLANDPDIIILASMWGTSFEETRDEFVNHPSYASLRAVKEGRVIGIQNNLMERQGPRSADAVLQLAERVRSVAR
ncbi:MAG: ABC transporter substrate-binding protein [Sphaerochaetaceae bacterium]|jgi:iron complex transport system substrate-binding protein|nr:ABC transporter substrate-binding protein [Sphaerochaetaceae bacterium]MDX9939063.1 ABC transporter substrate-binding protein [Sphaerochaetaceae bacterium]